MSRSRSTSRRRSFRLLVVLSLIGLIAAALRQATADRGGYVDPADQP